MCIVMSCLFAVTFCTSKKGKNQRPREQPSTDNGPKTPHPEAPPGMILAGSGKRDDDTLKHVKSLKSDKSGRPNPPQPQTPTCPSSGDDVKK